MTLNLVLERKLVKPVILFSKSLCRLNIICCSENFKVGVVTSCKEL